MSDSDHPSDGATGTGPPIQRSSQFDAIFEQFKGYVDSRLHELSTASASNTESSKSLSETKKLRREAEASKLKKKGNLKQFLFNADTSTRSSPLLKTFKRKIQIRRTKRPSVQLNSLKGVRSSSNSPTRVKPAG